jgi:ferredoxin--NADP+ reductase
MAKKFEVLEKVELLPSIKRLVISAPLISKKALTGQFVIVRIDEFGERFPLTLVDWDSKIGTITLIFQEVGFSTKKLGKLKVGEYVEDLVGPLGNPTEIKNYGKVAVIGGGVGVALIFPWIKSLRAVGNRITTIIGAKTANLLLLEKSLNILSDELHVSTDDGSKGFKGFTSDVLKALFEKGESFHLVMAAGPVPMMNAIAKTTLPLKIKTIVSLNPIMIDGTGMCGGCRVRIGEETKFACVDGPDFDAQKVDFRELINRLRTYQEEETKTKKMI